MQNFMSKNMPKPMACPKSLLSTQEGYFGAVNMPKDPEGSAGHRLEKSMSESLASVMRDILVDRMGWSKQKFRSDESVEVKVGWPSGTLLRLGHRQAACD